ncbi:MAG: Holliday junction DNA helicase RuvA [Desulfamplus sp.]|nr:Holliday junction DNA helicase RuvA [Desulfamplus sp.]
MIAYIEGTVLKTDQDGIILLAGHVGYEILLPVFVLEKIISERSDQFISLYIYYHQTERQPKPVLIGFNSEDEKDFFQSFISVDAIGPLKAVKAMEKPVEQIAMAIEQQDIDFLAGLKGIGRRTAQKIVAALHGKLSRFVSGLTVGSKNHDEDSAENPDLDSGYYASHKMSSFRKIDALAAKRISQQVVDVLVEQLGYTAAIAKKMVSMAMEKNPDISTPEQLFDSVLHGKL